MMHPSPARLKSIALILFLSCILFGTNSDAQAIERLRVIIETDAGGDRDDQATLVRMLMYTNEWDIEGIIADRTSKNQRGHPLACLVAIANTISCQAYQRFFRVLRLREKFLH